MPESAPESLAAGLALVFAAGFFQGAFMAPSKYIRGWAWENYWLVFAATAYLICPWLLAIATVPKLFEIYSEVSAGSLMAVGLYGTAWGAGAVAFGLGVEALGLALGFAVILGVAATAGAVIPLLVHPPASFTVRQGIVIAASLVTMLAGVAVCSFAGKWKETAKGATSYRRGVIICVASGLLSACGNLGFTFGVEITHRARSMGVSNASAGNALWTLLTFPLFLCNAGFSLLLLHKNGTAAQFRNPHFWWNLPLAIAMGGMWMAGMGLYGAGARNLGPLGSSLGWAILMASMVVVANLTGILTREWRGAPAAAYRSLAIGVGLLIAAIAGLGYANSLQ